MMLYVVTPLVLCLELLIIGSSCTLMLRLSCIIGGLASGDDKMTRLSKLTATGSYSLPNAEVMNVVGQQVTCQPSVRLFGK